MVAPVFVTVVAARTAKSAAAPSDIGNVAALALGAPATPTRTIVALTKVRDEAIRAVAVSLRQAHVIAKFAMGTKGTI
jgi:hypothetical protein